MEKSVVIQKSIKGSGVVGLLVGGQYFIAIITQIILARILAPSHFGVLAFVSMIALFFNNFINVHGDKYLVRESEITDEKVNNVFTLETILALSFFIIVIVLAPSIMEVFGKEDQAIFVQFLCISFFYIPLSKLRAIHERELSFYRANLPILIAQLVGGIIAIMLAVNGYGIWSLLWWKVSTLFVEVLILWSISSIRPKFAIDKNICGEVLSYGKPLLLSSALVFLYSHYDYYIVDRLTSVEQLGYYWLAFQVSHYFLNARTAINKVVFPALSRLNEKKDRYKAFEVITNVMSIIYLIPTIVVLLFGEELITHIYGVKWLPAVKAFQVFFAIVLVKAIASNAGPLLHSEGNTKADLKLSIINFILIVPLVYIGTRYGGIVGASLGILFVGLVSVIIAYHKFVKPMTGYGFLYYLWKPIFIVLFVCIILSLINWLMLGFLIKLVALLFSLSLIVKLYMSSIKVLYRQLYSR